jgi:vancomycin permeability regulator SanA
MQKRDRFHSVTDLLLILARAAAAFGAVFSLLSLAGQFASPGFDGNMWWIDLRPAPTWLGRSLLACAAILMLTWAVKPLSNPYRRSATIFLVGVLLLFALGNCVSFYRAIADGRLIAHVPVPLSLILAGLLMVVAWAMLKNSQPAKGFRCRFQMVAALVAMAIAFPVGQMVCFGNTDYRRAADVIVVLGAKTYSDGHPSDVLADRVRTACDLYAHGYATHLIFSGGPGDGPIDEPHAMRTLAMQLGVPDSAIILDSGGVNTSATVRNTTAIFKAMNFRRVLVVSHFYHLPRIKLAYQSVGQEVWTIPAAQQRTPQPIAYFLAREVVAQWVYYVRAV